MTLAAASLNGTPLYKLLLVLPFSGFWHADVTLTQDIDRGATQSLVLAGTTYTCSIVREVDWAGRLMLRLVGGAGGWRKPVGAKQYQSPLGVPGSVLLVDAAAAVGELPPDTSGAPSSVGPGWVRQAGAASLVLQQITPSFWQDTTGLVRTSPRASPAIASPFSVMLVDGAPGLVQVASEAPGDWAPGATFTSPTASGTVNRAMHRFEGDRLRTEVVLA